MPDWLDPLHDAETMRATDAWAISERGVPSLRLMEAAGRVIAEATGELAGQGPVRVVCGKGNNGGDGLVAARYLAEAGFPVEVLLLWPAGQLSADATENLRRLPVSARQVEPAETRTTLAGSGAVVDAIFGTGFTGAPRSPASDAIVAINGCGAPVLAADIASGVDASTGEIAGEAVRATVTVALHAAKIGHRISPGKLHTGELRVAPIGIPDDAPERAAAGEISSRVLALVPRRGRESTKFTSGQVVVVGGSRGLTGAVVLAASGAIRAGAGYATAVVPAELEPIFEAKLTEVMTRGCPSSDGAFSDSAGDEIAAACERAAAVVLGPGIGRTDRALAVARAVAERVEAPLVIDADGLNAHAGRLKALAARSWPTVITPHAGELGRLLERGSDEIGKRRLAAACEAAALGRCVVVLKGDDTIVADGSSGSLAVNAQGAPALATAGTGDVLAGAIGALIARGLEPFAATCAAVLAHARAGRVAAERLGTAESVIAGDVIAALPEGLRA